MTDLEKLAEEIAEGIADDFLMETERSLVMSIIRKRFDLVRAAGRIEGLEEAAGMCERLPNALNVDARPANRKIDAGTKNLCAMMAHAIRARIQELEGGE